MRLGIRLDDIRKKLLDACACPITFRTIREPVLAADGCTYERASLSRWIRLRGTSPLTRERMDEESFRFNKFAADIRALYLESWPEDAEAFWGGERGGRQPEFPGECLRDARHLRSRVMPNRAAVG